MSVLAPLQSPDTKTLSDASDLQVGMGMAVQTDPREWLCLRLRVPSNKAGAAPWLWGSFATSGDSPNDLLMVG